MSIIYNFSELAEKDIQQFAADLVTKINSESIFSSQVDFKIEDVEADEMSGNLFISLSHDDLIEVYRAASWQSANEDTVSDLSYAEPNFDNSLSEDTKDSFETLTAEIDGYKVTLDVYDVDAEDRLDVDVTGYSHEDSGIGRYDFWGDVGYDSQPYVEVEGTIIYGCSCYMTLIVEPITNKE
jgi:hypothetical protein